MSDQSPETLIGRHEAFLECRAVDRPLWGYWIGGYYPAEQFPRATSLWHGRRELRPDDVSFAAFAEDYDALDEAHRRCDDDFFYVGSAYWGIPWLEAILGCRVSVAEANCRAEPCLRGLDEAEMVELPLGGGRATAAPTWLPRADLESNAWWNCLLQFSDELVRHAAGRFPVCAPLLRGPGDAASAMLGGTAFVTALVDQPQGAGTLLTHCARVRTAVLDGLQKRIPAWNATHAAGGYPSKVWCRRSVAYYQEDCAALLSPGLFRKFLLPLMREARSAAEVNFIHLHSACLWPLETLLEDGTFDAIEINIDHEGAAPKPSELIPTFRRVQQAGRPLLLWGDCSPDQWDLIQNQLSPVGLSLQPFVSSRP